MEGYHGEDRKKDTIIKEKWYHSNVFMIFLVIFVLLAISVGSAGLGIAVNNKESIFKDTLVTSNTTTMTFKSGKNLIYNYPTSNSPAGGESNFSGYFNISVDAPGGIPNIIFTVENDLGTDITLSDEIVLAPVTNVPFKNTNAKTPTIKLYANVSTPNQNLTGISIHFY